MTVADYSLTLGIWQDSGSTGDVAANLEAISNATAIAARSGVELLVFPECYLTGYFNPTRVHAIARQVDGDVIASLQGIAATSTVAILVGLYEFSSGGIHNSALLIGADGKLLANYRKRTLFGSWEKSVFLPGQDPVLVEYRGIRIAVLICFDLEFPELARECAKNGADLIAVPTALMEPYKSVARHLVPARAIENQVYVAYANRTGCEHGMQFVGRSSIWDPNGEQLARGTDSGSELLTATVSKAAVAEARKDFRYLEEIPNLSLD